VYVTDETSSVASWFNAYSVAVQSQVMPFRKQFTASTQLALAGGTTGVAQTLAPQPIVADFLYARVLCFFGTFTKNTKLNLMRAPGTPARNGSRAPSRSFIFLVPNGDGYARSTALSDPVQIDMIHDGALQELDMQFSFSDQGGNLSPIVLQPGEAASVLLMFVPKYSRVQASVAPRVSEDERAMASFGGAGGQAGMMASRKRKMVTQGFGLGKAFD
jgi:hypothetical protein